MAMEHKQSPVIGNSPETLYAKAKTIGWLACLTTAGVKLDSRLFDCLGWSLDDDLRPLSLILEAARRSGNYGDSAKVMEEIKDVLKPPVWNPDGKAAELVDKHPELSESLRKMIAHEAAGRAKERPPVPAMFIQARKQLKQLFGLEKPALDLCELVYINQTFRYVESYFEDSFNIWRIENRSHLALMLGLSQSQLKRSRAEAEAIGLINADHCCRLANQLETLWDTQLRSEVSRLFCRPLKGRAIPLDNFCLRRADLDHAADLLRQSGNAPVHILLYGPPGTGKTTFARSLAKLCGLKAWAVASRDNDNDGDRRASLMACLNMSAKHRDSFVLVDEAERLLDTNMHFGRQTKDKSWLNDMLEQPGRRIVWISNQIDHIDQAVRRRFSFSLYFKNPGQKERLQIWRQIVSQRQVKSRLQSEQLEQLASNYQAPAAVIDGAVAQAKALGKNKHDFADTVERVLQSYTTLQGNGDQLTLPRKANPDFRPDGVCLEGSIEEFLAKCRRADSLMRSKGNLPAGAGTMLFYGPPGTGKTALARYLAKELSRECLVKRASDLLSCWLGGTEKLIAEAFKTAEDEESVLVIDEADSFIYSRDIATHSWESTHVNEFLTALEECRGFCICTTNRRENLDAAAMRRFSHKVAFGYARPEQILALYAGLLAPLATGTMTTALQKELLAMDSLTPGDFHAVRARYGSVFAEEAADKVEQTALVTALGREQALKVDRQSRRIGF